MALPHSFFLLCWAVLLQSTLGMRALSTPRKSLLRRPVQEHGEIRVEGGRLLDQAGQPVRLRGVSLAPSNWGGRFYSAYTVEWLAEDWQATVVRAPLGVEGGYLENPEAEMAKVELVVKAAIETGIYVIVCWRDDNAVAHLEQAKEFFGMIARRYGNMSNVLFEPFNVPAFQAWNTTIKPYHEAIVGVIRQYTNNLIILSTPNWSQDVDTAASDPVAGANLAYGITYNAGTPHGWLQGKVSFAQQKGIALFNTQWSAGKTVKHAGRLELGESQLWLDFVTQNAISDVNWVMIDSDDPSSALQTGVLQVGGWGIESLSGSGRWVRASLRGESPPPPPCEICATSGQNCKASGCCLDPGRQCFEKNEHFAACRESCLPGIDTQDPPAFQTSWTCKALGGACTRTCSAPGANCKYSQCCKDPALTCFEKDKSFSNCQASCTPGVHAADAPEFQTSWSCAVVGNASSVPDN